MDSTVISTFSIKLLQCNGKVRLVSPEVDGDAIPQPLLDAMLSELTQLAHSYNQKTPHPDETNR